MSGEDQRRRWPSRGSPGRRGRAARRPSGPGPRRPWPRRTPAPARPPPPTAACRTPSGRRTGEVVAAEVRGQRAAPVEPVDEPGAEGASPGSAGRVDRGGRRGGDEPEAADPLLEHVGVVDAEAQRSSRPSSGRPRSRRAGRAPRARTPGRRGEARQPVAVRSRRSNRRGRGGRRRSPGTRRARVPASWWSCGDQIGAASVMPCSSTSGRPSPRSITCSRPPSARRRSGAARRPAG